ncbi:hypothetical protein WJX72_000140 [[Myrmecia] bisecta]|uniref:U-box domain-containing protein n=1 Tax=[Myrmecia] bisecta TaxID=41462 RepID=A0AAW1Q998_9CHLO
MSANPSLAGASAGGFEAGLRAWACLAHLAAFQESWEAMRIAGAFEIGLSVFGGASVMRDTAYRELCSKVLLLISQHLADPHVLKDHPPANQHLDSVYAAGFAELFVAMRRLEGADAAAARAAVVALLPREPAAHLILEPNAGIGVKGLLEAWSAADWDLCVSIIRSLAVLLKKPSGRKAIADTPGIWAKLAAMNKAVLAAQSLHAQPQMGMVLSRIVCDFATSHAAARDAFRSRAVHALLARQLVHATPIDYQDISSYCKVAVVRLARALLATETDAVSMLEEGDRIGPVCQLIEHGLTHCESIQGELLSDDTCVRGAVGLLATQDVSGHVQRPGMYAVAALLAALLAAYKRHGRHPAMPPYKLAASIGATVLVATAPLHMCSVAAPAGSDLWQHHHLSGCNLLGVLVKLVDKQRSADTLRLLTDALSDMVDLLSDLLLCGEKLLERFKVAHPPGITRASSERLRVVASAVATVCKDLLGSIGPGHGTEKFVKQLSDAYTRNPSVSQRLLKPSAQSALDSWMHRLTQQLGSGATESDEAWHLRLNVNEMECPITQVIMTDPVIAADGHTYERAAIESWFSRHDTGPMTNEVVEHKLLIPNIAMRRLIAAYRAQQVAGQ